MVKNVLTDEAKFCNNGSSEIYFFEGTSPNLSKSFKFQFSPPGCRSEGERMHRSISFM